MWAPLLLSVLLAAVSTPGDLVEVDSCAEPVAADAACGSAPLCSARQRVKLACELRAALEERYVFLEVKQALVSPSAGAPFAPRRHLAACVAEERAIAREDDPLRFYDRMRRCIAAFGDGHLVLGALPHVSLGIGLRRVEGKIVVASREEGVVEQLASAGTAEAERALAVGTEVLEIDGRPVGEVLDSLTAFVAGSSPAARRERAVDALTRRDFAFPSRPTAALTLDVSGERRAIELPWSIAPGGETHPMTRAFVRRTQVPVGRRRPVIGHSRTDTILPRDAAASLREHRERGGRPAVRLGEVARRSRTFCYLQILTFHSETLSGPDGARPYASVLDDFVRRCGERELDVVLDLRQNEGGYLSNATALVAALLPRAERAPGGVLLVRASAHTRDVFQARSGMIDGLEPRRVLEEIAAAQRTGRPFTSAFGEAPVGASDAVGGYGGRVVALVSPTCMSACDRAVAMLRGSGRAVLVGEPSEGAGGSLQESRGVGAWWRDSDGVLSVRIPNAAMGVQRAAGGGTAELAAEDFFAQLAFENRPVEPDVPYATRLEDVTGENRGWLRLVEALLFPPNGPRIAAPQDPHAAGAPGPSSPRPAATVSASSLGGGPRRAEDRSRLRRGARIGSRR